MTLRVTQIILIITYHKHNAEKLDDVPAERTTRMPNAYAHYKLGEEVFPRLSPGLREMIDRQKALFQAGLYGPDIFFYYRPLTKTAAGRLGTVLHQRPAAEFFRRAKSSLSRMTQPGAGEAYLCGYVSHFALDSCCHSYVEYMVDHAGMDHAEMETEFDRALMQRDGLDPLRHHTAAHLAAITPREAEVMAAVHEGLSPAEALEAARSMAKYSRLLLPTHPLKRTVLEVALRIAGKYESLHGLLMERKPVEACRETTRELLSCYRKAVFLAAELIENYDAFLRDQAPLSRRFDRIFDGDAMEKERIKERVSHD